jgi:hypothetical protein
MNTRDDAVRPLTADGFHEPKDRKVGTTDLQKIQFCNLEPIATEQAQPIACKAGRHADVTCGARNI